MAFLTEFVICLLEDYGFVYYGKLSGNRWNFTTGIENAFDLLVSLQCKKRFRYQICLAKFELYDLKCTSKPTNLS